MVLVQAEIAAAHRGPGAEEADDPVVRKALVEDL
jgi:hypothetical protein